MKIPPFCPNPDCDFHQDVPKSSVWYVRYGHYTTKVDGQVQRYRCKQCGCHFSSQTFSLDYGVNRHISYRQLFELLITSSGIRDMGRILKASPHCITNRLSRLARQCLAVHADLLGELSLDEALVADGFESFAVSQYFPNNIQLLAGKLSQYWIYSDYAHLRRKGRMTPYKKHRNQLLQSKFTHGRVTVYESFEELVRLSLILKERSDREVIDLYTDRHQSYLNVMRNMNAGVRRKVHHICCSSTAPRTTSNMLFSVNYLDREIRKDLAEHTRETVQFGRNVSNQMERLAIYRTYHNYCKPFRISGGEKERYCHAEMAGISRSSIQRELKTLFTQRRFLSRIKGIMIRDLDVWLRGVTTPLKRYAEDLPAYAWA